MSRYALELALYDLSVRRDVRGAYAKDPDETLSRYRLDASERDAIRALDVAGLQRLGASPLLTMGFWTMHGPDRSIDAYLAALRAGVGVGAGSGASHG